MVCTVTLEGRKGILRARSQSLRYVGLALQHAFIRAADLRHLDEFFRRFGLEPGEDLDVEPAELRRKVRAWLLGRNQPWAIRLRDACKDRPGADMELMSHCEHLLVREARLWDGRPRDPRSGRAIGQILLVVKSRANPQPGLYAKWDQRLPESQVLHLPGAGPTTITRVEGFGWYEPHPLPIENLGQVLEGGVVEFLGQVDHEPAVVSGVIVGLGFQHSIAKSFLYTGLDIYICPFHFIFYFFRRNLSNKLYIFS